MTYARGHGGAEFIRNLGDQVKANPFPLALVAAGLGWMMVGSATSDSEHRRAVNLAGRSRRTGREVAQRAVR